MTGPVQRGRHYLRVDGRATLPVGAHVVPPAGPDWPWRVGAEAFERAFTDMAALGLDAALREVKDNRGTLFDPDAVDACERVLTRGDFELPQA